jgi:hypothetical protein
MFLRAERRNCSIASPAIINRCTAVRCCPHAVNAYENKRLIAAACDVGLTIAVKRRLHLFEAQRLAICQVSILQRERDKDAHLLEVIGGDGERGYPFPHRNAPTAAERPNRIYPPLFGEFTADPRENSPDIL